MKRSDFKYTTTFASGFSIKKELPQKETKASLEILNNLMPEQDHIDDNPDLQYVGFNGAVANLVNENGDGILGEHAVALHSRSRNKHLNIEHMRSFIIGCITNFGFNRFDDNSEMDHEDAAKMKDPFFLSVAGALWRIIDEPFIEYLEDCVDPNSPFFNSCHTSWEVGFDQIYAAIGSKKLADAEIITDKDKVEELMPFMSAHGGTGFMKDGTPVYRVIAGDPVTLGYGFTSNPAASVRGIILAGESKEEDQEEYTSNSNKTFFEVFKEENKTNDNNNSNKENNTKDEKVTEKLSQSNKTPVKAGRKIRRIMTIQDLSNIEQEALASMDAADVRNTIKSALSDANANYETKLAEAKQAAKDEAESVSQSFNEKIDELKGEIETLKSDLEKEKDDNSANKETIANLEKEKKDAELSAQFDARMSDLNDSYDLSEAHVKVIASQIRDLDEEAYATWKTNFELFAEGLSKADADHKEDDKGDDDKDDKDDDEAKAASKALDNAKEKGGAPANADDGEDKTLLNAFASSDGKIEGVDVKTYRGR